MSSHSCSKLCLLAGVFSALQITLQGCGGGGPSPTPAPTPPPTLRPGPTPPPGPSAPPGFTLWPIQVNGSAFYESHLWQEWHAVGMGMPNVGDDVNEWIKVLQRIKKLGPALNAIRIYELPQCALETASSCFEPFMKEADRLGVYVMLPASGRTWGYFPGLPSGCDPVTPKGCYEHGGVLGFGRQIINNFGEYPNVLAIVAANEMDQNLKLALPVLKAYVRDLKQHMDMCNTAPHSPARGKMRKIPVMYAATDGAEQTWNIADYLFCDEETTSIDIFGLNTERWESDDGGRTAYNEINEQVAAKQWPGAFIHSEEGGPFSATCDADVPRSRTWNQLTQYFANWHSISGFFGYAYYGNKLYNMFDGLSSTAKEYTDGKMFFHKLSGVGSMPDLSPGDSKRPVCRDSVMWHNTQYPLSNFQDVLAYDTGRSGLDVSCPRLSSTKLLRYGNSSM